MKKVSLLIIALILTIPAKAQNDQIAPTLTKAELIEYLQENYSVTNPLGYNGARDAMYGSIDNKDGNIVCVYTGFTIQANTRGDAFAKGINTEHTWPQGLFDSDEPMRGDIHHLFPTLVEANSARSNYRFDEIPDEQTDKWFFEDEEQTTIPSSNIDLYSELLNGTSFEPREDHKGNLARAIFYFWAIYQNTNDVSDDASFFEGMKEVLLQWHDLDPVDAAEVARSLGAEQAQGNRNPFIHDTTLVRRAFFDGDVVEPEPVPNPVTGFVSDIESSVFELTYSENNEQKMVLFRYDNTLTTSDTAGNPFTLTDYEEILEAEVIWEEGSTEEERIATSIEVIRFQEEMDTVISGPKASTHALVISGVMDGTLTGGTPKLVELYVTEDIPDLAVFSIGSANNGGGSDGVEFTLDGSAAKGTYVYVATESSNFNTWFGFTPDFTDDFSVAINGDDAIEIFYDTTKAFSGNEIVVDTFGEIDKDGSGTAWEYTDGWAYRKDFTGPDSTSFNINNWMFSGPDALEGESTNENASSPFPLKTYMFEMGTGIVNNNGRTIPNSINLLQNYPNPFNPGTVISYELTTSGIISLKVFDSVGREISTLENGFRREGSHAIRFDGTGLSSGVYIYQLQINGEVKSGKMLLIK